MTPRAAQTATELAWGLVGVIAVGMAWQARKAPVEQREADEQQAVESRERLRSEGRLRRVDARPEWLRRFERKVMGVKRLGDRKLQRSGR